MTWRNDATNWQRQLAETGYVVVENVLTPAEIEAMSAALERIERDFNSGALSPHLRRYVSTDRDRTRMLDAAEAGGDGISNIMELALFDDVFRDSIRNPRMLDVLEALFNSSEFSFHNLKCISKMPHNATPFQWHRDLPYLEHTSPNLLTCMLCVDEMTEENGATVVCPGSHRIAHEEVLPSDIDIAESAVPKPRVTVACPAGSAVFFHVNIVHGGGPNRSDGRRRNVISIWAGEDALPTTPARYAYEFLRPRSSNPLHQRQMAMTFQ